ncbi:hypothetical protein C8F01DRAFT_275394 [Mycena amicta]|nr:hypothetical protein C8F01DRAFT_275394 [Mycena amicta]
MLFLLAIASTITAHSSGAKPLSPTLVSSSDTCKDIDNCRRLFDIVWGCLATIFACVWVSVHPNIPAPPRHPPPSDAPLWQRMQWSLGDTHSALRSRLKLMLVGLLAPELVVGLAGRQLAMARFFAKNYNLSLTHGFFVCMGGFVNQEGQPIVTRAQSEQPGILVAIQQTAKTTIEDKSKGDALSKGVALLQGLWFVVQCIARLVQHLPLAPMEVVTLAFAFVNLFTWLLWWHKPLDAQESITVGLVSLGHNHRELLIRRRPWWVSFGALIGFSYSSKDWDPMLDGAPVPTFWFSSRDDDDFQSTDLAFYGEFLVAAAFGAIHCAAWHSDLPSGQEMWLWRVSAILLTAVPMILLFLMLLRYYFQVGLLNGPQYLYIFFIWSLIYLVVRVILLVLPIISLRALPPAAFVDIDWSVYIPHL